MAKIEQCMRCKKCDNFYGWVHYEKANDAECGYYEFPINNSRKSFKRLFSFKGRIGRAEIWLTYLGYFLILIILDGVAEMVNPVLGIMSIVLLLWIVYAQLVKRFHDLDRPWTDVLFLFILIYNLWIFGKIFFFKGIDEVNKYGTSPSKSFESQVYKSDDECIKCWFYVFSVMSIITIIFVRRKMVFVELNDNLLWRRLWLVRILGFNNVWNVGIVTILSNASIMRKRVQSVNIMSFL